jgi:hemin uptake protein HemP
MPSAHPQQASGGDNAARPVPSEALLQGRKTVEISHCGAVYRLQATRQGKLILTK